MAAIAVRSFRVFGNLVQKAGPYLLLEILLPGGTLFALLLFLYRRVRLSQGASRAVAAVAVVCDDRIDRATVLVIHSTLAPRRSTAMSNC